MSWSEYQEGMERGDLLEDDDREATEQRQLAEDVYLFGTEFDR